MGNYDRNVFLVAHSATSSNAVTQRSSRRPKLCSGNEESKFSLRACPWVA